MAALPPDLVAHAVVRPVVLRRRRDVTRWGLQIADSVAGINAVTVGHLATKGSVPPPVSDIAAALPEPVILWAAPLGSTDPRLCAILPGGGLAYDVVGLDEKEAEEGFAAWTQTFTSRVAFGYWAWGSR